MPKLPSRTTILVLVVAVALVIGLCGLTRCRSVAVAPSDRLAAYDPAPYATVLRGCVHDGLVDYAALRQSFTDDLDQFLDAVDRFGPAAAPSAFPTEADRLAFHLNAYNAVMLRRWIDAGAGADAGASDTDRSVNRLWFVIDQWRVDGKWISLDALEQRIIRPVFREPRVHFALVCGAAGCPPLLEEPFSGPHLDEQLDTLGRRWLRARDALAVANDGAVELSPIFDWYRADFEPLGGLGGVLDRYLDEDDPRRDGALAAVRAGRVRFPAYDWAINTVRKPDRAR